jgi:hypothetical protein
MLRMSNGEAEGKTLWFRPFCCPIMNSPSGLIVSRTYLQPAESQPQAGKCQTSEQTGTTIRCEKTWKTATRGETTVPSISTTLMTGPGHLLLEAVEEIGIDDFCHFYFINGLLLLLILDKCYCVIWMLS